LICLLIFQLYRFNASSDHDLAASARTFFSSLVRKNVYDLSLFLEKPFGSQFDFIYVDLRFVSLITFLFIINIIYFQFQSTIGKISSWLETANYSVLLVRDHCKEASIVESGSPLTSFYQSNPLATAFVLNFGLTIVHTLRNSHLHAFSDQNVKNVLENVDFIYFEELFTGLLKQQMGLCFVGPTDGNFYLRSYLNFNFSAKACTSLFKNELHNFIFEGPDCNSIDDHLVELSDDDS